MDDAPKALISDFHGLAVAAKHKPLHLLDVVTEDRPASGSRVLILVIGSEPVEAPITLDEAGAFLARELPRCGFPLSQHTPGTPPFALEIEWREIPF